MTYKSDFEVGRIMTPRFGLAVKPEFPWGNDRQADWTLKCILIWYDPGSRGWSRKFSTNEVVPALGVLTGHEALAILALRAEVQ